MTSTATTRFSMVAKPKPGGRGSKAVSYMATNVGWLFYFLLGVWYLVVGSLLMSHVTDKRFFTEWITATYHFEPVASDPLIRHYSNPAIFSTVEFWFLISLATLPAGTMYILVSLGMLIGECMQEPRKAVAMSETGGESDPTQPMMPKTGAPQGKRQVLYADNYMSTVLFFAKSLSYPVMGMIMTNAIVDKSGVVALFTFTQYLLLAFVFYLGDGVYLLVYAEHRAGFTPIVGVKQVVTCFMLIAIWVLLIVFIFYPLGISIVAAGWSTIPAPIQMSFIVLVVILGLDSMVHVINVYDVWRALWNGQVVAAQNHLWYSSWLGFSHIAAALALSLYFIWLEPALTTAGFVGI